MTDNVSNSGFSKISDTIVDSARVIDGLVSAGVLPRTFRVIKASIDFTDQLAVADGLAVIDDSTGNQVLLSEGDTILLFQTIASTTLTSGGSATLDVGLALDAAGGAAPEVATAFLTAEAFGDFNTGEAPIPTAAAVTVVGSNRYVAVDINTAALTAGALSVIMIVA